MKDKTKLPLSCFHWGTYRIESANNEVKAIHPFEEDPAPSLIGQGYVGVLNDKFRIKTPHIRKGWLDGGPGATTDARGKEDFVAVSWDVAENMVAEELNRVRNLHGNESIFAGSYGWASAGRFHHAQSHLKRFLNLIGGFTRSVNSYSLAAGEVILSHVLGSSEFIYQATSWQSVIDNCDLIVSFGGMPLKNAQIGQGGVGAHRAEHALREAHQAGVDVVNISPLKSDLIDDLEASWVPIRPSTDTALMIGLAYELLREDRIDWAFLNKYTVGFDRFAAYLTGETDGIQKTAEWAARICGIPADDIIGLAKKMAAGRTMISVAWSLTRQDHGEQPFWLGTVLAAMMGQIGVPGGGIGFGYGATNTIGLERPFPKYQSFPQGKNPIDTFIPVSRITEMLENPGGKFDYNGHAYSFPDARLIWWAGGNPFHHHQDLNRLLKAWSKPETVIVNEWCWNALAKHADIILPCTTPLERNDLSLGPRDPYVIAMEKVVDPVGEARNDFDIFKGIARHLGVEEAYTEGRDTDEWLRWVFEESRILAEQSNVILPSLETLNQKGWHKVEVPSQPYVMLADYRLDPDANPLKTPSGKIEIFSEKIASFEYDDCPGHPVWMEPIESLNSAPAGQLHLISNQPKDKLHSQLDHGPVAQSMRKNGHVPAMLNPVDAAQAGISQGDIMRVFNERGACLCTADLSDLIRENVIQISTGAWFDPDEVSGLCMGGNPNVLTLDKGTSKLGQGPIAHSCLVQIERYE
ncbi:MAG: molybdopterin-dependent oxidoreductase [Sneathiella sp.]